jgi:hypothetical protein
MAAKANNSLVLRPFAFGAIFQAHHTPAGNDAGMAGARASQDRLSHRCARDLACTLEHTGVKILLRHRTEIIEIIGCAARTQLVHRPAHIIDLQGMVGRRA